MKLKKYLYKKVESTNNVAIRLIKQGSQRGIILTDQQTKGKGQRKNNWISIKGNLFLSVFFEISKKISLSKITNLNLKKRPIAAVADNIEVRDIKRVTIKNSTKLRFTLLYDKNKSLDKRIKFEQLKKNFKKK